MRARLRAEKTPWLLLLVFVLLSAGIAAVGLSYYAAQKATILEEQRSQLAAIADLKIGQFEAWRAERLGDARIMRDNVLVNSQIEEFLDSGAASSHRSDILAWMESRVGVHDYTEAVLVALDGSVRLASPPTAAWIGPTGQTMVDEVLHTGEAAFSDLHRAGPEATLHLDLVIPLQIEDRGGPRTIGVLILRVDPAIYLFPLVQSWPTSSPSAETLLVRREGDQVLYLNPLRHVSDPALTLSFPITRSNLPAALAAQGVEGIVEGLDYRGVPVMAILRPVPNTSWYMVAKIDREEIYAPIAGRGWVVGAVVAILILAAAASIGSLWRSQRAEFVRGQVEAELERKVLTEHFGYLSKYANDAILLADEQGNILEANERAQATYGYAREELLELNLADLRPLETRGALASQLQQVAELGGEVFETLHVRKDGNPFPVEVSARIIAVEGKRYYQGIIRDITERKKAEAELAAAQRRYHELFDNVVVAVLRSTPGPEGAFIDVNLAMVRMFEADNREQLMALHPSEIYLDPSQRRLVTDEITTRGFIKGKEVRFKTLKGRPIWGRITSAKHTDARGQVYFDSTIEDVTERKRAEEALASSEQFLSNVIEQSPVSLWISDSEGTLIRMNQACRELFGVTDEEAVGKYNILKDNVIEEQGFMPLVGNVFEKGSIARFTIDYDLPRVEHIEVKEGTHRIVDVSVSPIKDLHGKLTNALVQHKDITERKQAEEALTTSEVRYRRLFEAARDGILILDADTGMVVDVNPFLVEMLGYSREQFLGKKIWELGVFKDIAANKANFLELQQKEYITFENLPLETAKGRLINVEFVSHVYQVDRNKVIQCNIRDITERKKAEERILRLNRMYALLSQTNQAIVRLREKQALLEEVCRVAVQHGKFRMAWIGWLDPETETVRPVAHAGEDGDFLARIRVSARDDPDGQGPVGVAIRTGRCDVCNDILTDPRTTPRRDEAYAHGYRASAAVPFTEDGKAVGTLAVYASEAGFFDQEEIHLLDELGVDLSFALDAIRQAAQRQEAVEALQESERKFRETVTQLDEGYYSCTMDGVLIDHNRAFNRMLGFDVNQDLKGAKLPDFWQNPEARKGYVSELTTRGVVTNYLIHAKAVTGADIVVMANAHLVKDDKGMPVRIEGTFTDITERKRAEEALKRSEALLSEMSTLARIGAWELDVATMKQEWTDETYAIHDRERGVYDPNSTEELSRFEPGSKELIGKAFEEAIEQGRPYDLEVEMTTAKGNRKWVRAVCAPWLKDGKVTKVRGTVQDITERKQAEEARQEAEARYRALVEQIPAVAYTDSAEQVGVTLYISPQLKIMTGYDPEEWEADNDLWLKITHPEDRARVSAEYGHAFETGGPFRSEYRTVARDGRIVWVRDESILIRDPAGRPLFWQGIMLDITERKRAEEEIRKLNEGLEQRVIERTAQLQEANKQLESEMIERREAEQARVRRVAELQALNTTARIVVESLDMNEMLSRAADEALRLVGVEAAGIFVLDKEAGELELVAQRGLSDEFIQSVRRMKVGEGMAGRAAETGEPVVIGRAAEYPGALRAFLEKERIQSVASVPLVGSTGMIGVMNLGTASPQHFDSAGVGLLLALGQQLALGVEKARLHAETRQRNRELSVLYQISRATAESLDLEKTLNNAVEATAEALNVEAAGIYLLEPDGNVLRLRVHRGISDETAKNLEWVKLGEGMSGKAAAEKRLLVLDVQDYPSQRLAPYIVQERLQSLASVPLLSAGQAVGAINLSTRRVRAFPPEEMALLTAIGQQLASAVQNARLFETVQQELAERRLAEERLRESTAQLEAANKELEAFSYSVSHDLRAPLRAIDGFSRIVLDEHAPALAPEAQRYLHLVQDNTQQMGRLVDDLLAFSRLSRQPMAKQRVDPTDLVRAALQDLNPEQKGRQIDLVIRDLPSCQADPGLLRQVWVNLLSNALKFTRRRERAVIEVGAYEEDTHPVYYVKDNGVGFDMRYVGKLFGVFQRLHRSEDYEGTGVGLAIVQRIVHRHGGRVWAEAKVDEGAMFCFSLEGGNHDDGDHRRDPAGRGQP